MRGFSQLCICRDAVTELAERGDTTGLNQFAVALARVLPIQLVRHAEYFQFLVGDFGCVCVLETLLDVLVPSFDKEEFPTKAIISVKYWVKRGVKRAAIL